MKFVLTRDQITGILAIFVFLFATVDCSFRDPIGLGACSQPIFVDDVVFIDASFDGDCILELETQDDRILAFSIADGDIEKTNEFLSIHDGYGVHSPVIELANNEPLQLSRKDLPKTLYTTNSIATVRFYGTPMTNFQLKIQKATNCSSSLEPETQCGRLVDEVSCYCAILANRNQTEQTMYCLDYGMRLVSFEDELEEQLVHEVWGTQIPYWTSLTDTRRDDSWIWESTMTILSNLNYTNWFPGRPILGDNNSDCMMYGGNVFYAFWGDVNCTVLANAICEARP